MTKRSLRRLHAAPVALALAASLVLAGCGDDDTDAADGATTSPSPTETASESPSEDTETSPSEPAAETVEVTVEGDTISPTAGSAEVGVGEKLVLQITSDRAGELHVHSNPEQEPAFEPGKSRVVLTFDKPGQVDIEEHESHTLVLRVLVK